MVLGHIRKLHDLYTKYDNPLKLLNFYENSFRLEKIYQISKLYYQNKCYQYSLSLLVIQNENLSKYGLAVSEEKKQITEETK